MLTAAATFAGRSAAPVVTPDETGWRVGAKPHWLWTCVTPETTVYAICPGRSFDDAADSRPGCPVPDQGVTMVGQLSSVTG